MSVTKDYTQNSLNYIHNLVLAKKIQTLTTQLSMILLTPSPIWTTSPTKDSIEVITPRITPLYSKEKPDGDPPKNGKVLIHNLPK